MPIKQMTFHGQPPWRLAAWLALILQLALPFQVVATTLGICEPDGLPNVQRDTLLTGLPILVGERPGSTSVTVAVVIKVGSTFDRVGKAGLARLTAECIRSGGGGYDAERVRIELEEAEAQLEVDVNWDRTCILLTGPARNAAVLIDLLGRLITLADFAKRDFAEARFKPFQEAAMAAAQAAQTEEAAADALFFQTLYDAHPYHHSLLGTPESIAAITQADVADFYRRHWLPNNAAVVIVGDVTAAQVRSVTRRAFGGWAKGKLAPATFLPPNPPEQLRLVLQPGTGKWVHVRLGGLLPEATPESRAAWLVLAELIKRRVQPWTLELTHRRLPDSPWMLSSKLTTETAVADIDVVLQTLDKLRDAPPSQEEVQAARTAIEAVLRGHTPNNRDIAQQLVWLETYGLSPTIEADLPARLAAVTPADCQALASQMLGRGRLVVLQGGSTTLQTALAKFGNVELVQP
ncbi:insulinase family protein [Chloracidobacterium validum]|uniref:Insulinase family protein n=1 Tax=Chloracidobacterium validum TaxID=2821543 RepID=A0ABX8B9H9_9BACT|nr:pitrilysin family protein [Chloracidobacterium validum]QUW03593.1 insulinase family protein [Chloracidobacterium validum]